MLYEYHFIYPYDTSVKENNPYHPPHHHQTQCSSENIQRLSREENKTHVGPKSSLLGLYMNI